jgi:hypothetical protein
MKCARKFLYVLQCATNPNSLRTTGPVWCGYITQGPLNSLRLQCTVVTLNVFWTLFLLYWQKPFWIYWIYSALLLDTAKCLQSMTSTKNAFINNNWYGDQCKINWVLPIDNMIAFEIPRMQIWLTPMQQCSQILLASCMYIHWSCRMKCSRISSLLLDGQVTYPLKRHLSALPSMDLFPEPLRDFC